MKTERKYKLLLNRYNFTGAGINIFERPIYVPNPTIKRIVFTFGTVHNDNVYSGLIDINGVTIMPFNLPANKYIINLELNKEINQFDVIKISCGLAQAISVTTTVLIVVEYDKEIDDGN